MSYVLGIDGGGSKTRAVLSDHQGHVIADLVAGPSNYHTVGLEACRQALAELRSKCLSQARIKGEDLSHIYLGLAGADLPEDFDVLNGLCRELFGPVPFTVDNDSWISLRSGLEGRWGAVSICGTGANAAAVNPQGQRTILRALTYEVGNFGGGYDLARLAVHKAFRADEGIETPTLLQQELPRLYDCRDMKDFLKLIFPQLKYLERSSQIPPLVFHLASQGDRTCQDMLIDMGRSLGEAVAGVIRRAGMCHLEVPVVLGGSLYRGSNPLLIDELTTAVHRVAPRAFTTIPQLPPVAGACLLALDQLELDTGEARKQLLTTLK